MPQIIATTDEIGIREQRDTLFLSFDRLPEASPEDESPWERIAERNTIIDWLNRQSIGWEPCLHCSPGTLIAPYRGAIYLDVAPTEENELYQKLLAFIEDESGRCRFDGVGFWLLPLDKSLLWNAQRRDRDES
jgi:hypothetical protein